MGFWGWYFLLVASTGIVLVVYFWIRWYLLLKELHRRDDDG